MRANEIDRLSFLQNKRDSGQELNEKETERLNNLEEKLANEIRKREEKENGQSGNRVDTSSSGGDSEGSGAELRKSESTKRTNGNKSDTSINGASEKVGGSNRPSRNPSGSNRAKSGDLGGSSRELRGDDRGSDRGRESGDCSDIGSGSGSDSSRQESEAPRVVNLAPKPAKPKRKVEKKKKGELDSDTISMLIQSGFGLIASSTGRKNWEVSKEEADSVAEPLDTILENMSFKQKKALEKYSAPLMLASALAGIIIPRVMEDMAKPKSIGGKANVRTERTVEANVGSNVEVSPRIGSNKSEGHTANATVSSPANDTIIAKLFG